MVFDPASGGWESQDPNYDAGNSNLYSYTKYVPAEVAEAKQSGPAWHHLLPKEVFKRFELLDMINIHDKEFGLIMKSDYHNALHNKGWDQAWVTYLHGKIDQTITREDIVTQLKKMMTDTTTYPHSAPLIEKGSNPRTANYVEYLRNMRNPHRDRDLLKALEDMALYRETMTSRKVTPDPAKLYSRPTIGSGPAYFPDHPGHPENPQHAAWLRASNSRGIRKAFNTAWSVLNGTGTALAILGIADLLLTGKGVASEIGGSPAGGSPMGNGKTNEASRPILHQVMN